MLSIGKGGFAVAIGEQVQTEHAVLENTIRLETSLKKSNRKLHDVILSTDVNHINELLSK